jgi:hypothetical protein
VTTTYDPDRPGRLDDPPEVRRAYEECVRDEAEYAIRQSRDNNGRSVIELQLEGAAPDTELVLRYKDGSGREQQTRWPLWDPELTDVGFGRFESPIGFGSLAHMWWDEGLRRRS